MCGLFGYSGKDPVDPLRLTFLAAENQERGDDATGVYGNFLSKSTRKAKDFVVTPEFKSAIEGATNIIGHTRKATVGLKVQANAHPFELEIGTGKDKKSVVGTHNGQIFFQCLEALQKKYGLAKTEVDSEFIFKLLLHHNFDYDKTLSELEGFIALAFIRPEHPEYLYLYHRASRPLAVGFLNGSSMYYSSETEPLDLIGCTAIEPLETDNLYIFKNGGLVEVSPVKKPQIIVTTEDVGLATWLQGASQAEKLVLGISGAAAKNTQNAAGGRGNQRWLGGTTNSEIEGGQSNPRFPKPKLGEIGILSSFPIGLYSDEQSIRPPKVGRFYDSGNNSNCYVFAMLHSSTDTKLGLPAWYVRVKGRPDINCVSTHNGMVALAIPSNLCGTPLKLEIINPLQQEVIYRTTLNKPIAGKVLEVALSIPFRCSEEKTEASESDDDILSIHRKPNDEGKGQFNPFSSFSELFNAIEGSQQVLRRVRGGYLDEIPRRSQKWLGPALVPSNNSERAAETNGTALRLRRRRECVEQCDVDSIEEVYNPKTDILHMNYPTALMNLDEVKTHNEKIEDLLSQSDPDVDQMRSAMVAFQNYFLYQQGYLESTVTAYEDAERVEAEGQYRLSLTSD